MKNNRKQLNIKEKKQIKAIQNQKQVKLSKKFTCNNKGSVCCFQNKKK